MSKKEMLGDVAMFVAASLNYPNPDLNRLLVSTIKVNQYKVKFNDVRIYCRLADPVLVQELWTLSGNDGVPNSEFLQKRLKWDSIHYRECYLSMANLLSGESELRDSLVRGADYRELLCTDEDELNDLLITASENKSINWYFTRWGLATFDELKRYLVGICRFSNKS